MNTQKRIAKFENYWLTDLNFRCLIWDNISFGGEKTIFTYNEKRLESVLEKEYSDIIFLFPELWLFLVGFFFPEREPEIERYDNEARPFFYSGKKIGLNGGIWKAVCWAEKWLKSSNRAWHSTDMPYLDWGISKDESYTFYEGYHRFWWPTTKSLNSKLAYLIGGDLREEKILTAAKRLIKNS